MCHRGQVDLRPRGPGASLRHGHGGVLVLGDGRHQTDRRLSHRQPPTPGDGGARRLERRQEPATSPGRSPETRPSAGPSDAARPCTWAASAAALAASRPRAQKAPMIPESTSPLPAVARDGPPASANSTSGTDDPSGVATAVERSLEQDHRPGAGGEPPRRREALLARRRPGDAGVLAVVRRQDARRAPLVEQGPRRADVAQRAQRVGVDHQRHRGAGDDGADLLGHRAPVPSPGPITMARHLRGRRPGTAPAQPSAGRCMRTASVGHAATGHRARRAGSCPTPAAIAPRVHEHRPRPPCPAEPAAMPTAWVHLLPLARPAAGRARRRRPRRASAAASGSRCRCRPPRPRRSAGAVRPAAGPA